MPCYFILSVSLLKFNIYVYRHFLYFLQNSENPNKIVTKDGLMGNRDVNTKGHVYVSSHDTYVQPEQNVYKFYNIK